MDSRVSRSTCDGRGAAGLLGRRAAAARRPARAGRGGARARLLYQPDHLGRGPHAAARRDVEAGRAGPHPAVVPGFEPRAQRLPQLHEDLRPQAARGPHHQGPRLPDGAELRDAPVQPAARGPDHRDGRGDGSRLSRTRQRAVLRLGLAQPRDADALARDAGHGRGGGANPSPAPGRPHEDPLGGARLRRRQAQALHGGVGQRVPRGRARRRGAAVPQRAHAARARLSQCARAQHPQHLAGEPGLRRLPWHGLDEQHLPELRREGEGPWGLSLPGFSADGRRGRYGPGVSEESAA
ncbi:hypothetical protein D3C72_1399700 [compost metagenome]